MEPQIKIKALRHKEARHWQWRTSRNTALIRYCGKCGREFESHTQWAQYKGSAEHTGLYPGTLRIGATHPKFERVWQRDLETDLTAPLLAYRGIVIVCTNMFGDIVYDLSAQLVGGLGFAASASTSDKYGVFEPTHGSAPKYAGQYKVNPTAAILSAKLMVEWLGEKEIGKKIGDAVAKWVKESSIKTYDMGGTASTLDVAHEIVKYMNQ